MKSVLISIRPKWVEKIASGKKTIEVRKTAPKKVPFKAYIYCTKDKPYLYRIDDDNNFELTNSLLPKTYEYVKDYNEQNGKVIGEFICDEVYKWEYKNRLEILERFPIWRASYMLFVDDLKKTCLTYDELEEYGKGKTLYGWHISDLKIYDKPKELSEFKTPPCEKPDCGGCKYRVVINTPETYEIDCFAVNGREITRPPQSYMFVEEVEEQNNNDN